MGEKVEHPCCRKSPRGAEKSLVFLFFFNFLITQRKTKILQGCRVIQGGFRQRENRATTLTTSCYLEVLCVRMVTSHSCTVMTMIINNTKRNRECETMLNFCIGVDIVGNVSCLFFPLQWECRTDMDNGYRFGRIEVTCEGYSHPSDDYILKGSCGLEYTLELTEEGRRGNQGSWSSHKSGGFGGGCDYTV